MLQFVVSEWKQIQSKCDVTLSPLSQPLITFYLFEPTPSTSEVTTQRQQPVIVRIDKYFVKLRTCKQLKALFKVCVCSTQFIDEISFAECRRFKGIY
ncbi:CLUMA_CG016817, isoform A [Clunio marinus]|uniref:CLUMA_CG016817, isoform A n=1 Tax=Clunio marinus TaxID=568069 RepID=A0A1J1IWM2_9DIPT|nr:CLUMA_CG016817, isoform A [Clunio marinus]